MQLFTSGRDPLQVHIRMQQHSAASGFLEKRTTLLRRLGAPAGLMLCDTLALLAQMYQKCGRLNDAISAQVSACRMQRATDNMQRAACCMLHAACSGQHATCSMLHAAGVRPARMR